jgi:simple sugar transport system substrate-binding protein
MTTASASLSSSIPQVFSDPRRKPRVVLLRGVGEGAFLMRFLAGAQSMADALGIELSESNVQGGWERMAAVLEAAITQQVDAVIISHSQASLQPLIERALGLGIKVVAVDALISHPQVPEIEQDDMLIGFMLARQLAVDTGGDAQVIYVNVNEFAPLEKRDRIWQDFKWRYPNIKQLDHLGAVTTNTAEDTQGLVAAALAQHPNTTAVLAMWDEFAKGAVRAIMAAGQAERVKVYSVDITDEDIGMMTEPGSPWVATVATDAYNIGRLAMRAATALVAGEQVNHYILVEPQLITQQFLRQHQITNMEELVAALPALGESQLIWPDWMKALVVRNGYPMPRIGNWAMEALRESEAHLREVVAQQQRLLETVRELSTPVMPIHDHILVLPLIGNIDSARSVQIMEALLSSVQEHSAEMIIIDITGVPVVDTAVANHLLLTTQATKLLGAQCILVGISPEVAQTIVQLGVNLQTLHTAGNLQAGIEYALARVGRVITLKKGHNLMRDA